MINKGELWQGDINGVSIFGRVLRTSIVFLPIAMSSHHSGRMLISTDFIFSPHFTRGINTPLNHERSLHLTQVGLNVFWSSKH